MNETINNDNGMKSKHIFRKEYHEGELKWIYKGDEGEISTIAGDRMSWDYPSCDSDCELMEESSS